MGKEPDSALTHGCMITPINSIAPILYTLCDQKDANVADVKSAKIHITFRRWLTAELQTCWDLIQNDVQNFNLHDAEDVIIWKFDKSRKFSVKSLYNVLIRNEADPSHKKIWKGKVPLNIKIFIWLMTNNALLTKDNLIRSRWSASPVCQFCDQEESVDHLFFTCPIAKVIWVVIAKGIGDNNIPTSLSQCWSWCEQWLRTGEKFHLWGISSICWAIWKARNKAYFEGKFIKNPIEILCHAGALLRFWTGLYGEVDRAMLIDVVNTMLKVAAELPKKATEDKQQKLLKFSGDDEAKNL